MMASSSTNEGGSRSKPSSPRGSWFKAMFRSKSSQSLASEGEEECSRGKPPLPSRAGGGGAEEEQNKARGMYVCDRVYVILPSNRV
jgi:hypothetical protein